MAKLDITNNGIYGFGYSTTSRANLKAIYELD